MGIETLRVRMGASCTAPRVVHLHLINFPEHSFSHSGFSSQVPWPGTMGYHSSSMSGCFSNPTNISTNTSSPLLQSKSVPPDHIKVLMEHFRVLLSMSKGHTPLVDLIIYE